MGALGKIINVGSHCRKQEHFVGLSFPTISGYGSNGAIIHYRPERETAANIGTDKLFLVDSGAQYLYVALARACPLLVVQ